MDEIQQVQRATYLRGLLERYGTLSLPLGSGLSFASVQVFQPLRLRVRTIEEQQQHAQQDEDELAEFHEDGIENPEHEDVEETTETLAENGLEALALSPRGRLVMLGGPGSGKTTVLKHLLCQYARLALEQSNALLPIFLSLPDLARAGQDLADYLVLVAREFGLPVSGGTTLFHVIQLGQAFVCLDSLDEVLPRLRPGIIRQINHLAEQPGNVWIVGSRFTDYKGGQFQRGQFQEWELQTLDEARRLRLAAQLFSELSGHLSLPSQTITPPDPHAYVRSLAENQQATTWGENPLLFSLGAVAYLRRGSLTGSRALLYREVIDALLETRESDAQRRVALRELLAEVALELYQTKGRTCSEQDLRETLMRINSEQKATWSIEEMLYQVLNSGVLDVVASDSFSFRHQTFQEYLAASALAQRFMSVDEHVRLEGQNFAWSKHTYSRWNEIQRLLVGILVQEYGAGGVLKTGAWLERLLERQESAEGDPGHLNLELAIRLLGEVAQLNEWQRAETLKIEERAAIIWLKLATVQSTIGHGQTRYNERLWILAPEIGRLRLSAQLKVIDPLIQMACDGHPFLSKIFGGLRSRVAAERLSAAWRTFPGLWEFSHAFEYGLQEYAPVDFVLAMLQEADTAALKGARHFLAHLGKYAPVAALVDLLADERVGTRVTTAKVLIDIVGIADIPVDVLVSLCQSTRIGALEAACVLAHLHNPVGFELLQESLPEADNNTSQAILEALAHLKALVAIDKIIVCLRSPTHMIRVFALRVLDAAGQDLPSELRQELLQDDLGEVRSATLKVLSHVDSLTHLAHFFTALRDSTSSVVAEAIRVLRPIVRREPLARLLVLLNLSDEASPGTDDTLVADAELVNALVAFFINEAALHADGQDVDADARRRKSAGESEHDLKTVSRVARSLSPASILASLNQAEQVFRVRATQPVKEFNTSLASFEEASQHAWPLHEVAVHILALDGAEKHIAPLLVALGHEEERVRWTADTILKPVVNAIPLEDLVAMLQHPLPGTRYSALHLLAEHQTHPEAEPLLAALRDSHASVRAAAAAAFASWTERVPLAELVEATNDVDVNVRQAAARALGQAGLDNPMLALIGILNVFFQPEVGDPDQFTSALRHISPHVPSEPLLQAMYELLGKSKNWLASIVAEGLAAQGTRMPVAALRAALKSSDQRVRWLALTALAGAGAAAPIEEIIKLVDDHEHARYSAINALNTLWEYVPGEIFLRILREEQREERGDVSSIHALIHKGEAVPCDLLAWALAGTYSQEQQSLVAYLATLAEIPPAFHAEFLLGLALAMPTVPADVRYFQKEAFKSLVPRFALADLQSLLKHRKAKVRQGILLLSRFHPEEFPQEIFIALLSDPEIEVRQAALLRLRQHSQPLPVQVLRPLLGDAQIRRQVIIALGILGADAPIDDLLPMFNSSDAIVRLGVLKALRRSGVLERVSITFFLNATGDANWHVRDEALKALKEKDPATAITCCIDALSESLSTYRVSGLSAFQMLQELDPALIPEIVQEAHALLQGGVPGRFLRSLHLSSLAEAIGEAEHATPELLARLDELLDWPHWEVRVKATQALGKLRRHIPDTAIQRLLKLRQDSRSRTVHEAADEALAEILSLETGIEDD